MNEKLIPLSVAAKTLGVSPDWLRDAIDCEELRAYNRSHGSQRPRWYILLSEAQAYLESRQNRLYQSSS